MPKALPPKRPPGRPHLVQLKAGTELFRIHSSDYSSTAYNPRVPVDELFGGRFDSIREGEAFLYAAGSVEAAVCEVFLRQVEQSAMLRRIPRVGLRGKRLATLKLNRDLSVVSLRGSGLSAIGQDAWLTSCEAVDYETTRAWSDAIRRWEPAAQGFVWRSRRNQELMSYIFFEPESDAEAFDQVSSLELFSEAGLAKVRAVLEKHYFTI